MDACSLFPVFYRRFAAVRTYPAYRNGGPEQAGFIFSKKIIYFVGPETGKMQKLWYYAKRIAREYTSPVFILLLLLSTILWYIIKLGDSYTAEIPVWVRVEDNRFRVMCVAEGTGSRIFAHRYLPRKDIKVRATDLQLTPSTHNKDQFVISPFSLQNIISIRNSDLRIVSLGELQEITLPSDEP